MVFNFKNEDETYNWALIALYILYEDGESMHVSEILSQALMKNVIVLKEDESIKQLEHELLVVLEFITKNRNKDVPFKRNGKNIYTLRNIVDSYEYMSGEKVLYVPDYRQLLENKISDESKRKTIPLIQCIGMYWNRDKVNWRNEPEILGKRRDSEGVINFNEQRGIYILYDNRTPIYVGRVLDRSLGQRLYEHTYDRLENRWNRFSWFGVLKIGSSGQFIDDKSHISIESVIASYEAILIESMEPPLNRKRGDDFSSIEFKQK